jgi:glycerol-3-phosphate O-acyltransferase
MSIRWLLAAYQNLTSLSDKITIVPVMMSYDRIFEHINIAREMISGDKEDFNALSSLRSIHGRKENQLGNVYMKCLEPVNIRDFLMQHGYAEGHVSPDQFDVAAQKLSESLLKQHNQHTPITLNSIIAARLLHATGKELGMKQLLHESGAVYDYLKTKSFVNTYMSVKPMQTLVESHVDGMGFQMASRGKKTCRIPLKKKYRDDATLLGLAFYSLPLSSILIHESFIAHVIHNSIKANAMLPQSLNVDKMYEQAALFESIVHNEHLYDYEFDKPTFLRRLHYFAKQNLITLNKDSTELVATATKEAYSLLDFFCQIMQPSLDTYTIVLLTLEQLCGKNIVLKEEKIVKELHIAFKNLHAEKAIPYLHSCLKEIIRNSLSRYEQMNFLTIRAYPNKRGTQTEFITCHDIRKQKLTEIINFLGDIRPMTPIQAKVIESEVVLAI